MSTKRWLSRGRQSVLISQMASNHLENAINYCLTKKGRKHKKLDFLVEEARKRGLKIPEHKFIEVTN